MHSFTFSSSEMITLKVYNGELFERGRWWYVGFAATIVAILGLSLFYKAGQGIQNIIGVVIMLMIVGAYLFLQSKISTETELILKPEGILIGERVIPFSLIQGFVVEMEKTTGKLKNIVLVLERSVEIFTLRDAPEQQQLFFAELSKLVPFLESYQQTWIDKMMRKLKL